MFSYFSNPALVYVWPACLQYDTCELQVVALEDLGNSSELRRSGRVECLSLNPEFYQS